MTLDVYSLKKLDPVLSTDGENWFVQESGRGTSRPVLDARMAALYSIALELLPAAAGEAVTAGARLSAGQEKDNVESGK